MTPNQEFIIDRMDAEYKKLKAFFKNLEEQIEELGEDRKDLVRTFFNSNDEKYVVDCYFEKAKELIKKRIKEENDPKQKIEEENHPITALQASRQILTNLRQHTLLLTEIIINSYPYTIFSKTKRRILKELFVLVTARIYYSPQEIPSQAPPSLRPVLSPDFRYVHFNYTNNRIGLIGIPPEVLHTQVSPGNSLAVLWHEIAGHAIAKKRSEKGEDNKDEIERWAERLKNRLIKANLWTDYRDRYKESIIQNIVAHRDIITDVKELYKEKLLTKKAVDGDTEWQAKWLAEFLEDLFGMMVFEGQLLGKDIQTSPPIRVLEAALRARYPDANIGDYSHPPPELRISVASAYLEVDFANSESMDDSKPDKYDKLTIAITSFCKEKIKTLYPGPVEEGECKLAEIIVDPSPTSHLWEKLDQILDKAKIVVPRYKKDTSQANRFIEKINSTENIDDFLTLKFIEVDWNTIGPIGSSGLTG